MDPARNETSNFKLIDNQKFEKMVLVKNEDQKHPEIRLERRSDQPVTEFSESEVMGQIIESRQTQDTNSNLLAISMKQRSQISLDVKRTFRELPGFDHLKLEKVLRNLCHPRQGNFSYFQGLNNLTGYFLNTFDGDELVTYNFVITLLEDHLRQYLDGQMENMKVLVFFVKRLVEIFFPRISRHIHRNKIVDPLVVFSNWVLGLFVFDQSGQSEQPPESSFWSTDPRRVSLERDQSVGEGLPNPAAPSGSTFSPKYYRQMMDIFVAEGWVGFFKCLLVMLQFYEAALLSWSGSNLMSRLSNFPQFVFQDLEKQVTKKLMKSKILEVPSKMGFGFTPKQSVILSQPKDPSKMSFQLSSRLEEPLPTNESTVNVLLTLRNSILNRQKTQESDSLTQNWPFNLRCPKRPPSIWCCRARR